MTKCADCPVASAVCYGGTGQLPHLCEWARDPARRARVVRRCEQPPPGDRAPAPPAAASAPYEPITRPWLARVNTCPYRECRTGCERTRCHAGRGDRFGGTTLENCRACLRGHLDAGRRLDAASAEPWEDLSWLRRFSAAGPDPLADVRRYTTPADPAPQAVPLVGWLHIATIGRWEPILRELLSAVERSGLRAATSRVFAGVVGPEADLSWLPDWLTVVKRDGDLEMGENSTLQSLWDWSKSAAPSKVWYLHTKGASRGQNPNVTAWRDYLAFWNVLRWREAAAALDGPYDCYGVDYATPADDWFATVWGPGRANGRGFVGNFWWADSAYLASLRGDQVILSRSRWDAEWSFVGGGDPRVRQPHETRLSLYSSLYPRPLYDGGASP